MVVTTIMNKMGTFLVVSSEDKELGCEISEWWSEKYNNSYDTKIAITLKKKSNRIGAGSFNYNNNYAPSFLRSLCEIGGDCFGPRYFFWGSTAPKEKYRGPKQSPTNSHNDWNKDDGHMSQTGPKKSFIPQNWEIYTKFLSIGYCL